MRQIFKIGKSLGPSGIFAGYVFVVVGAIYSFENLSGLLLVLIGLFMSFTSEGTIIDFDKGLIKSYTSLFGLIRLGKWYPVSLFDKFSIYKSNRSYTTYSRANIPLTVKKSDICLDLMNKSGSLKLTVNRFDSFESARNEMSELIRRLHLTKLEEWAESAQ
jgi:hypothetical protein